jgi:hypothetical protein
VPTASLFSATATWTTSPIIAVKYPVFHDLTSGRLEADSTAIKAQASGIWGTAPLDSALYGSNSLIGREVYVDSAGQLRGKPEQIAGRTPTDLAAVYPAGTSLYYIPAANIADWPGGQLLVTHKTSNNVIAQWCYYWSAVSSKSWYRNGTSTGWAPWVAVSDDTGWVTGGTGTSVFTANATNLTLTNSWARAKNGIMGCYITGP